MLSNIVNYDEIMIDLPRVLHKKSDVIIAPFDPSKGGTGAYSRIQGRVFHDTKLDAWLSHPTPFKSARPVVPWCQLSQLAWKLVCGALRAFPTWFFLATSTEERPSCSSWSDTSFQTKCMAHMRILQNLLRGKIVLSHSSNIKLSDFLRIGKWKAIQVLFLQTEPMSLALKFNIFKAQAALALGKMMKHVYMPSLSGDLHKHKLLISLFLSTMNTFHWIFFCYTMLS